MLNSFPPVLRVTDVCARAFRSTKRGKKHGAISRVTFIFLVSAWMVAVYQLRPDVGDKQRYIEAAELLAIDGMWLLLYKEPIFSLASKIGYEIDRAFGFGLDNGVALVNVAASLLLATALERLCSGQVQRYLMLLPLLFLYDFIYLSAETVRAHLGVALFLWYVVLRREGRGSVMLALAAVLTHFSLLLPILAIEASKLGRRARNVATALSILIGFAVLAYVGTSGLWAALERVAGAGVETERQFPIVRAYLVPSLVLAILLVSRRRTNQDVNLIACVFTALTPVLFFIGATEISLRAFSMAMIFIILFYALEDGRLTRAARLTTISAVVLFYTAVSPLGLLYIE